MAWGANYRGDRLVPHLRAHLLVAHGERSMRDGLAAILRRAGYDIDDAGNLDEARAVLDKGEIQALVVSFNLPPDGCVSLLDYCEGSPPTVILGGPADDVVSAAA